MELSWGSAWAAPGQGDILVLVIPACAAASFSVCLDSLFWLWRESVSLSVVLIAVNLPPAEVLGLGLFCQHGSE